jgi:hypothetical protein
VFLSCGQWPLAGNLGVRTLLVSIAAARSRVAGLRQPAALSLSGGGKTAAGGPVD